MTRIQLIYGPTATGKTALAIKLAKKFNGEIISADSRQVYKGLDIGSGKVNLDANIQKFDGYWIVDGAVIHGFDIVEPGQNFSASDFVDLAETKIKVIEANNKRPIIVGGTGFYIKSLISGIAASGIEPNLKLRRELEKLTRDQLLEKLSSLDPKKVKTMNNSDRLNPRRLIRAIEIASSDKVETKSNKQSKYQYEIIGLTASNEKLYKKSDDWLNLRLKNGLIGEVQSLLEKKVKESWLVGLGLEYRWITKYLLGEILESDAINRIKGDTHSFIRRQKTWFKQFDNIKLFDITNKDDLNEIEKLTII